MSVEYEANGPLTRAQFAGFLDRFADSLVEEPELWENDTLERFLRAWPIWVIDMDSYFLNRGEPVPSEPTWQMMAQMLSAARVYE